MKSEIEIREHLRHLKNNLEACDEGSPAFKSLYKRIETVEWILGDL